MFCKEMISINVLRKHLEICKERYSVWVDSCLKLFELGELALILKRLLLLFHPLN